MGKILVLGAGKSSGVLINHLLENGIADGHTLLVADASQDNLNERAKGAETFYGNVGDVETLRPLVALSSVVVSMLPPHMHPTVARLCLGFGKHLLTASYVSPEIRALHNDAKAKGLLFLMECGLDPGLDHMSAMELLDRLISEGAEIESFKSYCGGLVAPESDNNPWGYKITWNPRNVVLAGQGTAQFLEEGIVKYVPYHHIFQRTEPLYFEGYGDYEAYPNRDSLPYIGTYGLQNIKTFLRGTIRKRGFCSAWHSLVHLGLTDDTVKISGANNASMSDVLKSFLPNGINLVRYLNLSESSEEYQKLAWLGLGEEKRKLVQKNEATPAEFLQALLEKKWKLETGDKDLVLMQHKVGYFLKGKKNTLTSTLSTVGNDGLDTAMARTVGLPLAVATLLLLSGKINLSGVQIPVSKEVYHPVLMGLKNSGIIFREKSHS